MELNEIKKLVNEFDRLPKALQEPTYLELSALVGKIE